MEDYMELSIMYNNICSYRDKNWLEAYIMTRKNYEELIEKGRFDIDYYLRYCTIFFCLPYFEEML